MNKEKFLFLTEHASLDAKDCVDLLFTGLHPTLKLAFKIFCHGDSLKETCRELERIEASLTVVDYASNSAPEECLAMVVPKPYIFNHITKLSSTYLLLLIYVFLYFL